MPDAPAPDSPAPDAPAPDARPSDAWTTVKAHEIRPGDVARRNGIEFEVARVDDPFLGRDAMVCLIEDTPDRWNAYPMFKDADVEVRRPGGI